MGSLDRFRSAPLTRCEDLSGPGFNIQLSFCISLYTADKPLPKIVQSPATSVVSPQRSEIGKTGNKYELAFPASYILMACRIRVDHVGRYIASGTSDRDLVQASYLSCIPVNLLSFLPTDREILIMVIHLCCLCSSSNTL